MTKKYILFAMLLCAAPLAFAQNKLSNNIFLKKLPNGLEVLVVEDHSTPLATVMMTFKVGAFTESAEISGLTSLYQFMLGRANKDFATESDRNYHAGQMGIRLDNAATAQEYTSRFFTLPTANLEEGLAFMNTGVRFAKFNSAELEKAKEMARSQLKQKESSPYFLLTDAVDQHLWGDLHNRKEGIGNIEVISAATPASMQMLKNKFFYPNNALLVIGGDVSHDAAFESVARIYGDWKAADFDPISKWPIPEVKPLDKTDYFMVESPLAAMPLIQINWQGPDTRSMVNSTYAADVFSYLVNQQSSQLHKALIESGLASSVSIGYLTQKYGGPITLTVIPNPEKLKECIDEIKRQIALMDSDNYLTADQIQTAKRMLEIKRLREEDVTTDYVHTLSFWWSSASFDYYASYDSNLKKVSQADIKSYVQHYIKGQPYCAALLISPELKSKINAGSFFKSSN